MRDAVGNERWTGRAELDEASTLIADARATKVVQSLFTFQVPVAVVSILDYSSMASFRHECGLELQLYLQAKADHRRFLKLVAAVWFLPPTFCAG